MDTIQRHLLPSVFCLFVFITSQNIHNLVNVYLFNVYVVYY